MVKKRSGLGRGLGALIPDDFEAAPSRNAAGPGPIELEMDLIRTNPDQPRKHFDEKKLEALKASVLRHGVMQPVLVEKERDGYRIIAGERRYRAARKAGLKKLPCLIRTPKPEEAMELALIENLQREDLNDMEEAAAYRLLMDRHGFTQERVAEMAGKSRSYVGNMVRLLGLEPELQALVASGKLSGGHGRTLLGLPEGADRKTMAEAILSQGWSVRETERRVKRFLEKKEKLDKRSRQKDPELAALEESLRKRFATRIRIRNKKNNSGRIEIEYHGLSEFERILNLLKA